MIQKLLLALATCLPIALSGCGGGGASSSSATELPSPSGGSGTQTPEAALDTAKRAVDNADSEKTEAAVQAARSALSKAVETAEAALAAARTDRNAAQAALDEAQEYEAEQADALDGLQPIDLAAVKTARTAADAAQALIAAKRAVAEATEKKTERAIRAARRALSQAVLEARVFLRRKEADLEAAQAALDEAQEYEAEQTEVLDSIQTLDSLSATTSPTPAAEYFHTDLSTGYFTWEPFSIYIRPLRRVGSLNESHWRNIRRDAHALADGFRRFADVNGIEMAEKTVSDPNLHYDNHIVGIGRYSTFEVVRNHARNFPNSRLIYQGGHSAAFGDRSLRPSPWIETTDFLSVVYRGAIAGVRHDRGGATFTGEATLTYSVKPNGEGQRIVLSLPSLNQNLGAPIKNDGAFSARWFTPDDRITYRSVNGAFYGPNWEEAAGIVQLSNAYGGWLVQRAEQ